MTQVNPIWAQVHTVAADGTTTFSDDVVVTGSLNRTGGETATYAVTGAQSPQGSPRSVALTFSGLTQDYAGIVNAFDAITTTDTGAFNYSAGASGGALRASVGHVNIQSVGATVAEACALDGIVAPYPTATGTLTLGFGGVGQIQNTDSALNVTTWAGLSGQAYQSGTGTFFQANGTMGTVQTTAGKTGNITHGYGGDFAAIHNSTSTFTEAFGLRTRVSITGAGVISSAPIALEAFVQTASTGSVTSNNAIGVRGRVLWGSTTNITSIYGVDGACSVTAASTVSQTTAVRAEAPTISGGGAITIAYGVRIADQSGAGIGTSFALNIDNQATAGAVAIRTLGGIHQFGTTANAALAFLISDLTTNLYTVDTRTTNANSVAHKFTGPAVTVVSANGINYSVVSIPAFTYSTTGATAVTSINGLALNVAAPTISSAGVSATAIASTVYIAGAPINSGSGSLTASFALHVVGALKLEATVANGSVATALSSVGPTGAATTVQEWLKVVTANGTRYIPCF